MEINTIWNMAIRVWDMKLLVRYKNGKRLGDVFVMVGMDHF